MQANTLRDHIFSTYNSLRYGMAILAFIFPFGLFIIGVFYGIKFQPSMSAYYFATAAGDIEKYVFPMRVWFVGVLFILGAFLYLYKGFSKLEDYLLNAAGVAALGVAIFPMHFDYCKVYDLKNCTVNGTFIGTINFLHLHYISAVAMFLFISLTVFWCAQDTLPLLEGTDADKAASYRKKYYTIGTLMLFFPILGLAIAYIWNASSQALFFVEAAGVFVFAAYWYVKSGELKLSEAEKKVLRGEIRKDDNSRKLFYMKRS